MAVKKVSAPRGRERRRSERADVRLSMRVEAGAAGTARIVTESQNISSSGVYCHSSHYLAPLSKVQLTIVLPRTPGADVIGQDLVKCDGIVVRCDQRPGEKSETPYELACMFTALAPPLRERIEEFVTWRNLQALRAALAVPTGTGRPEQVVGTARGGSGDRIAGARPVAKRSAKRATKPAGRSVARTGARPAAKGRVGRARG